MPETTSVTELICALCADQRRRWQEGDRVSAAAYLEQHPTLRNAPEQAVELIYNEVLLREKAGELPALADYLERYPHYAAPLKRLFEVHQALGSSAFLHDNQPTDRGGRAPPTVVGSESPVVAGFEILGELGHGGMGVVYKARQLKLNRVVALKKIRGGSHTGEDLARFRAEGESQARLQHPGIVQVFEVGDVRGEPYFAMEYVEGTSLAQKLGGTPQPVRASAELTRRLAQAVQHAHERGVVHRDLKPGNVLLTFAEVGAKISDFGLAKRLDSEAGLTQTGVLVGTPSYMSPEQAAGKVRDVGTKADLYALGAILYEMLTGRPPFLGETPIDTLMQVKNQEPVPVRRLQPKVPRDLETITLKCLRKDPSRRYDTATALADDLGRFLEGRPILARPVGGAERLWRWASRNPVPASLASSLLLVFLGVLWQWARAEREWGRAEGNYEMAVKNLDKARKAVRTHFVRLSEIDLSKEPGTHALQRRLLQDALAYFQGFLGDNPDDPELQAEVADSHYRVGVISGKISTSADAIEHLTKARDRFEEVLRKIPNASVSRDLAATCHDLGVVQHQIGQREQARANLDRARELRAGLTAGRPTDRELQRGLALTHLALGRLHAHHGEREPARKMFEQARGELMRLAGDSPGSARIQAVLADTYRSLGMLEREAGARDAALKWMKQATEVGQLLTRANPTQPTYQNDLSENLRYLARLHLDAGVYLDAQAAYDQARTIQEKLARANPGVNDYQSALAVTYSDLGNLARSTNRREDAVHWHQLARGVYESLVVADPGRTLYQSNLTGALYNLANLLRELGRRPEALAAAREALKNQERLVKVEPGAPKYQYELALVSRNLGMLQRQAGQLTEALASHHRACEVLRKLIKLDPGAVNYLGDLAFNCTDIGIVQLDANRPDLALPAFREGLEIQETLVREFPENRLFRYDLALSHHNLGVLLEKLGGESLAKASNAYFAAAIQWSELVQLEPANARYRDGLAKTCYGLSEMARKEGNLALARCQMGRTRDLYDGLIADEPSVPEFQGELARAYLALANLERDAGRFDEALRIALGALEVSRRVLKSDPTAVLNRADLAQVYNFYGEVLLQVGRPDEALLAHLEAGALRGQLLARQPGTWDYQVMAAESIRNLGNARRDRGELDRALGLYREAVRRLQVLKPQNGVELYAVACDAARCIGRAGKGKESHPASVGDPRKFADLAMEALRQAVGQGFADVRAVEVNETLAPLRVREDFKIVLDKMRGKEPRKAP